MQRQPRGQGDQKHLYKEHKGQVRGVEVRAHEGNAHDVHQERNHTRHDLLTLDFVQLRVDVKEFGDDKSCEGDSYDVCLGFIEENYSAEHDQATLEDGFPHPDQESFQVQ